MLATVTPTDSHPDTPPRPSNIGLSLVLLRTLLREAQLVTKRTFGGSCRLHVFKAASADSLRAIFSSRILTACFTSVSIASNCRKQGRGFTCSNLFMGLLHTSTCVGWVSGRRRLEREGLKDVQRWRATEVWTSSFYVRRRPLLIPRRFLQHFQA